MPGHSDRRSMSEPDRADRRPHPRRRDGAERRRAGLLRPGRIYLALLDALYDSPIAVTICRQEGGAAMMAEAWGKLTGRPGIVMATRGPGATNASAGLHVGRQDSTPMILLLGQVGAEDARARGVPGDRRRRPSSARSRSGSRRSTSADRIPEIFCARHAHGDLGPARARSCCRCRRTCCARRRRVADAAALGRGRDASRARRRWRSSRRCCAAAKKPLRHPRRLALERGRGRGHPALCRAIRSAGRLLVPPADALRPRASELCRRCRHRHQSGARRAREGGRRAAPDRRADERDAVVGLHADRHPRSRGRRWSTSIPAPRSSAASTGRRSPSTPARPPSSRRSKACSRRSAHAVGGGDARGQRGLPRLVDAEVQSRPGAARPRSSIWLRERLPDDAIVTNGAGNYTGWVHRFFRFRRFNTQLAPTSGSMGYGLPAAIAAKLRYPGAHGRRLRRRRLLPADQPGIRDRRPVRRGGRHRSSSTTASTARSACIRSATIPGRAIATDLVNPDFAALARAHGGHGETVATTEEFAPAFERAVASGKPAIIEVKIDPEAISTSATLSGIRGKGRH